MRSALWLAAVALLAVAVPAQAATVTTVGSQSSCLKFPVTLDVGDTDQTRGGAVSALQRYLFAVGFLADEPSGVYGTSTVNAVMDYQTAEGIVRVGTAGPVTRASIALRTGCAPESPFFEAPPEPEEPEEIVPPKKSGLSAMKVLYKRGKRTDDGFTIHDLSFTSRKSTVVPAWWTVRVYCEQAVVRFGDEGEFGCGEEERRLASSQTRLGNIRHYRLDAVADGAHRGRVTVRAWAYDETGKVLGEGRAYFWVRS